MQLIPSYKKQLSANLLVIGNGNLDTQNRIKVYADRVKSMKLQKELDNSLILPNINDLQRVLNADDIQYYNMQYRPHLVQGQFKSEFQHAEDLRKTCTVDIHYDQAFTRRLRSSINKREIALF